MKVCDLVQLLSMENPHAEVVVELDLDGQRGLSRVVMVSKFSPEKNRGRLSVSLLVPVEVEITIASE